MSFESEMQQVFNGIKTPEEVVRSLLPMPRHGGAPEITFKGGKEHWRFFAQENGISRDEALRRVKVAEDERTYLLRCETPACDRNVYLHHRDLLQLPEGEGVKCEFCQRGEMPRRLKIWQASCPAHFREGSGKTNPNHPDWPREQFNKVRQWSPTDGLDGKSWLYVVGNTGKCKSRMLHWLTYLLIVERRCDVRVIRGNEFRREITEAYRQGCADRFLETLANEEVLAWDDFGQDTLGAGPLADLWEVIDARYSEQRPTLFTSNFKIPILIDQLQGKNDASCRPRLASMARRIEEMSHVIVIPDKA